MRFSLAVAALAPVLSVYAADILVTVGAGGLLAFNPPNITAAAGDTVNFQFQSKNHSVTQSTFGNPCQIMTTPAQGIDSDFQPVDNTSATVPQWSFTVDNATTPLWFFCKQTNPANHCQKGMVFSINAKPDGPKSYAVFQAAAMAGDAAAAVESSAAAAFSTIASAVDSAAAAATSAVGGAIAGGASAIDSAISPGASDAANAINSVVAGANGVVSGLLGGGAQPTASAGGNGTAPGNAGFRVGGSAMSLVVAVGLTVMLL